MPPKDFIYPDLQHIEIVLVEPQTPGNIGAAARAMKNFGLSRLKLINPCDYLSKEARMMAVKAEDILEKAAIYTSLSESIQSAHLTIATTVRIRETHFPTFTPSETAQQISQFAQNKSVALVFGREDNGLTTDEIHACRIISTIPTHPVQPSVNLAQSVMIYAYEIFKQSLTANPNFYWDYAEPHEVELFYQRVQALLERIEFKPKHTMEDFMVAVKRVFGRAHLEERDVRLLHKIFQEIEFYIRKVEQGK
ncbi:RNA methyltransferase [bacterium]|nr:RNA methyltransferase [bacterium]